MKTGSEIFKNLQSWPPLLFGAKEYVDFTLLDQESGFNLLFESDSRFDASYADWDSRPLHYRKKIFCLRFLILVWVFAVHKFCEYYT